MTAPMKIGPTGLARVLLQFDPVLLENKQCHRGAGTVGQEEKMHLMLTGPGDETLY
jgi:hypothetical protein